MAKDINQPLENTRLRKLFMQREAAMQALARLEQLSDKERREREAQQQKYYDDIMDQLYEEIITSDGFLSVVELSQLPKRTEDGQLALAEGTTMKIPTLETADGRRFYPAFIGWDELEQWTEASERNLQTMVFSFDQYISMVLGMEGSAGLVVDPFSHNLLLDRRMVELLKERKEAKYSGQAAGQEHSAAAAISELPEYPKPLVQAICRCAQAETTVRRIWLCLMEANGQQKYLLVADIAGDVQRALEAIAAAAGPHLTDVSLDMQPLSESFAQKAADRIAPIYSRQ